MKAMRQHTHVQTRPNRKDNEQKRCWFLRAYISIQLCRRWFASTRFSPVIYGFGSYFGDKHTHSIRTGTEIPMQVNQTRISLWNYVTDEIFLTKIRFVMGNHDKYTRSIRTRLKVNKLGIARYVSLSSLVAFVASNEIINRWITKDSLSDKPDTVFFWKHETRPMFMQIETKYVSSVSIESMSNKSIESN